MFQAQLSDALKGKPKAVRRLFELGRKTGMFTEAPRQGLLQITEPTGERGRIIRMFNAEQEARKQQAKIPAPDQRAEFVAHRQLDYKRKLIVAAPRDLNRHLAPE